MVDLGEHFRRGEVRRHSEWLRQQRWFIKAREDQERREEIAEELESDLLSVATEAAMATDIQITAFETKLGRYDEATVTALMENQEALDRVRVRLHDLLERAYVMDDGRRVFKTEDGTQIFDEFGREVGRHELDFDAITPDRPSWEEYQPHYHKRLELETQRRKLLEFQEKIGTAREKIADGEISESELSELEAELDKTLPPSVRAHLPGFDSAENAPDLKTGFASPAGMGVVSEMPSATRAASSPKLNPMD